MRIGVFLGCVVMVFLQGCDGSKKSSEKEASKIAVPAFNRDSAYSYVKTQVEFGPRVPNTEAHRRAAQYLVGELRRHSAKVFEQDFKAVSFDGVTLQLKNIVATFHPEKPKRILLAAHWDTRPFADKDLVYKDKPLDGANDGASGVGVLLEIARLIGKHAPENVGVDIILFDGEDWGEKEGLTGSVPPTGYDSWWCLGSQYWATHKYPKDYSAFFAIVVDMVGEKNARFYREETSLAYAPSIVEKVWHTAEAIGYSDYFVRQNVGGITDDHVFVNRLAKIPTIDIVPYHPGKGFFGDFHHTTSDNLVIIDPLTLQAVGATLLHTIYTED